MRVIAGSARRLTLVTPKGYSTRPTSDKVKETLFNIINSYLYDASFLDLFSGTGGIGIEALSRGAKEAYFIEKDKEAVKCIKKNLETTHFTDRSMVLPYDVFSSLYNIESHGPFDIIFMDPPYDNEYEAQVLKVLSKSPLVDDDTLIIVEASIETDFSYLESIGFNIARVKEYKNNKHVFIYRKES